MKKFFLFIFVCSFIGTIFINQKTSSATERKIDTNFTLIAQKINKEITLSTELSTSSNPYDYIQDNPEFNEIISLGNDALPYLQERLSQSENNGLQEYIVAIAIERIARVDLKKKDSIQWETAKEFNSKWKKHLSSIPTAVDEISSNSKISPDEKRILLSGLGTPAIPFILDKIESGNSELSPVIIDLTENPELGVRENDDDIKEQVANNKDSFERLKRYVLEQK